MKEELAYILVVAVVGMAFTFLTMPLLLKFCHMKGFYDLPGGRKVHHLAVPRLGGVLFMPAMLVGLCVALLLYTNGQEGIFMLKASSMLMAVGAFLIYIVGAVDDLVGMKAGHKFAIQLVAALVMPFCGLLINDFYGLFGLHDLPLWFSYPFTVFVILLIVNSVNLIDGIDGLASGLCICILVAYVYLFSQMSLTFAYVLVAAGVLGALVAFFFYNVWGKAEKGTKAFMGDSGSLFLGYVVAYLSIKYATSNLPVLPYRPEALMVSYTLLIVPTFDVIRVALFRLWRRRPIFGADKTHIHHVVMAAGFSMHQAWCIIMALFFFFCVWNAFLYAFGVADTWIVVSDIIFFCLFFVVMHLFALRRARRGSVERDSVACHHEKEVGNHACGHVNP